MRIDHINLVVSNLERSAVFYERVFGLRRGFAATLEGEWIEAVTGLPNVRAHCLFLEHPNGGLRLELLCYAHPLDTAPIRDNQANQWGLRHLAFEVEDLEATLEKLRAEDINPLSAPVEVPFRVANLGRKKLCYFRDPDGILLEIAAYEETS